MEDQVTFIDVEDRLVDNFLFVLLQLAYLWNCISKTSAIKLNQQTQITTWYNRIQGTCTCLQVGSFIFNKNYFFGVNKNLSNSSYNLGAIATSLVSTTSNNPMGWMHIKVDQNSYVKSIILFFQNF
jgi:hypothetical protein